MCEYCGCQRIPVVAELTQQHDDLRAVAREASRAARAADRSAAVRTVTELLSRLRPHTQIEERGLFPAMAADFSEHVDSLVNDHSRLEDDLAAVLDWPATSTGWVPVLERALGELFQHILREQDGLFPAALATLTPEQWDAVEEISGEVRLRADAPLSNAAR